MAKLSLEIVTTQGVFLREDDIDEVVVRRHERRFRKGSEIAIFPEHSPMLVRIPDSDIRYHKDRDIFKVQVSEGFVEVRKNHITMIVPSAKVAQSL